MSSITSANSVYMLSVATIFASPVILQGYSADDAFTTASQRAAEVQLGVDGVAASGFVYALVEQEISFLANSPSTALFDQWYLAQLQAKDVYTASGSIRLPGLGQKWTMSNGTLTSFMPIPDAKRVLQPRKFGITWQSAIPSSI